MSDLPPPAGEPSSPPPSDRPAISAGWRPPIAMLSLLTVTWALVAVSCVMKKRDADALARQVGASAIQAQELSSDVTAFSLVALVVGVAVSVIVVAWSVPRRGTLQLPRPGGSPLEGGT